MERAILKGDVIRHIGGHGGHGSTTEPRIRTLSHDGKVHAVEIRCDCGRTITLELVNDVAAHGAAERGGGE